MNDLDLNNIIYEKIGTNSNQYTIVNNDYGKKILVNHYILMTEDLVKTFLQILLDIYQN